MNESKIIRNLTEIIDEVLPQMGKIVLQDYARLNNTLIAARKFLANEPKSVRSSESLG